MRLTLHSAPSVSDERDLRVRPMQQEEIHLREPQPRQALLGGALELARGEMRRPDLGGDEHVVALDAGCAQSFADLALVVVHLRGIDVAVAKPQRLLDDPRAGATAQIPGAEPDQRNAGAMRFDDMRSDDICFGSRHGALTSLPRR